MTDNISRLTGNKSKVSILLEETKNGTHAKIPKEEARKVSEWMRVLINNHKDSRSFYTFPPSPYAVEISRFNIKESEKPYTSFNEVTDGYPLRGHDQSAEIKSAPYINAVIMGSGNYGASLKERYDRIKNYWALCEDELTQERVTNISTYLNWELLSASVHSRD